MDVNTLVTSLTQTLDPTLRLQAEQVLEVVIISCVIIFLIFQLVHTTEY